MILKMALQQIPGIEYTGSSNADLQGIAYSSRLVHPGDLFVAIKGAKADGSQFAMQAVSKGAVAIASEQSIPQNLNVPCIVVSDARKFPSGTCKGNPVIVSPRRIAAPMET